MKFDALYHFRSEFQAFKKIMSIGYVQDLRTINYSETPDYHINIRIKNVLTILYCVDVVS